MAQVNAHNFPNALKVYIIQELMYKIDCFIIIALTFNITQKIKKEKNIIITIEYGSIRKSFFLYRNQDAASDTIPNKALYNKNIIKH